MPELPDIDNAALSASLDRLVDKILATDAAHTAEVERLEWRVKELEHALRYIVKNRRNFVTDEVGNAIFDDAEILLACPPHLPRYDNHEPEA